jgi:cytochrome c peroxidase
MKRKPIRLLVAVAAIAIVGFAVVALAGGGGSPAATVDMHHGKVKFAKGQEKRILNAVDAATADTPRDDLVAEGRKVFRNAALFEDGESCQTCHAEGAASPNLGTMAHDRTATDSGPNLAGMTDFNGPRDVPALWGLAKTAPYFWDGSVGTLKAAILRPVKGHMTKFVEGDCSGAAGNTTACDEAAGALVAQLMAYAQTLDPPATAFDEGKLSPAALAGEKLFQGKAGCIECHGGPLLTDNLTHDTGVPQVTFKSPYRPASAPAVTSDDMGAPLPPADPACTGANPNPPAGCEDVATPGAANINTPQLRDLRNTAPYMHNGAFDTLEQVVRFYNGPPLSNSGMPANTVPPKPSSNLAPLNLTTDEMNDLVAYLESL